MDLARAPCRAPLTARKKGSGYENGNPVELVVPDALPSTSNYHSAVIMSSVPKTVFFFAHWQNPKACPVLSNQTCLQVQFS